MIYLLDTDVFTLAHLDRYGLRGRIEATRAPDEVAVSVVTRIEVLTGRFAAVIKAADGAALLRMQELLVASDEYLSEFRLLLFDSVTVGHFDRLRTDKAARKTDRNDLLIACVALAHGATLVTRNTKDYANVPNLAVENWAA